MQTELIKKLTELSQEWFDYELPTGMGEDMENTELIEAAVLSCAVQLEDILEEFTED